MPHAFSERLAEGPVLCDGAMGTMLYARGVPLDGCFDVLNLNSLRVVQAVHADYIAAGADAIETNTFGANRFKLAVHGLEAQVREINRRGARLARDVRESAGRDVWVLGSIGPLGKYLEPLGTVTADEASEAFREQAEALLEGGVDAFVVETFSPAAAAARRRNPRWPCAPGWTGCCRVRAGSWPAPRRRRARPSPRRPALPARCRPRRFSAGSRRASSW